MTFFTIAYLGMLFFKQDLLFRLQEQSIFLFTTDFLKEALIEPGGMLVYLGRFLTQFFYLPWLGALIFTSLLFLTQQLLLKSSSIDPRWHMLSLLPPAFFLINLTQLSYNLYVMSIGDIAYSQMLGYLLTLGGLVLYQNLRSELQRWLFLLLFLPIFYPLAGFHALAGMVYLVLAELLSPTFSVRKSIPKAVVGLLLAAMIPQLASLLLYPTLNTKFVYSCGTPNMEYYSTWAELWIPILAAYALAFLLFGLSKFTFSESKKMKWLNPFLLATSLLLVVGFSNWDPNFRAQIRMERALGNRDWNKVLDIAAHRKNPTRNLVLYRNIALARQNQLCQRMFTYPDGSDTIRTSRRIKPSLTNAPLLYYYYGLPNYSYHWCMELMVQYGMKVDYLRYMAKSALLNGEYKLAAKYLHPLQSTLFYRSWSRKANRYATKSAELLSDPEFKEINELLAYTEQGWEPDQAVEACIHFHYNHLASGSFPMLELSMASILSAKSAELFWNILPTYLQFHAVVPVHVQEAVLLYSAIERMTGVEKIPIDPNVLHRFRTFYDRTNTAAGLPTGKAMERIEDDFGDTFWYYYLFVKAQ